MPLVVDRLYKRFGERAAVRGLSLALRTGECYALLGPNGAGKTTTLRCVLGLVRASAGHIELCGHPIPEGARAARARVGVVPQIDNLDPDFTAAENLAVYGRYFGIEPSTLQARIPRLLAFAGLAGRGDDPIRTLSGGMKRRLTLARALVNDPDLLLLDEPTTGLDPQARHLIWERLRHLLSAGKTILLTTHFMDEAERLASRLAILDDGAMIAEGTPHELIERHIEPQVVEVYTRGGAGAADAVAWARTHAAHYAPRHETSGETVFCYVVDATPLLAHLATQPGLRYLHRPANLEDMFMKLTGRELRD
ncbi:MAG TPA: ATP-binding cassette domain-containing protein [Rhodocyclaceae bacterium]|nr:ATP-binding cassette domain-containing protein [Rhodocyclaceae bacterium]